jgi:leader peptidase (prepilin peptidase)/N-methyltransferase
MCLGDPKPLVKALLVASASAATYAFLYALSRGGLGMGDVKFAFPLGLCVGWFAANSWLVSIFIAFLCAGLVAVIGIVTGTLSRKSRLAFGPYMFFGTLIVCGYGLIV